MAATVAIVPAVLGGCTPASSATDGVDEPPIGPAVLQRFAGVIYDESCSAAPVVVDDAVYYLLPDDQLAAVDRDWYHASAEPGAEATIVHVADPIDGRAGELVVFADGVAEFIGDDGNVVWLTVVAPDDVPAPSC